MIKKSYFGITATNGIKIKYLVIQEQTKEIAIVKVLRNLGKDYKIEEVKRLFS